MIAGENGGSQQEIDCRVYELAREYLLNKPGVTPKILQEHLIPDEKERPSSLADVYRQLVWSAQEAQAMPRVIGGSIGGVDNLKELLCGYEPTEVIRKYGVDPAGGATLFRDIREQLRPTGKLRDTARGSWTKYCRAVTSGAAFLAQFQDQADFNEWVEYLDLDNRTRGGAPMIIAAEVHGIGFTLACNFLKELGYINFGKPDIHLKKIFVGTGLSPSEHAYQVFKAIDRVARSTGRTAYDVDKLFWLVGSGSFYRAGISVKTNRDDFIEAARQALGQ